MNQTINYNKDILVGEVVVVKCFCTIVANESMSYFLQIVNKELYRANRATVQLEVDKYKAECEAIAKENNVPMVSNA